MRADAADAFARPRILTAVRIPASRAGRIRAGILAFGAIILVLAIIMASSLWLHGRSTQEILPSRAIDRLALVASVVAYEIQLTAGRDAPTPAQVSAIQDRLPPLARAGGSTIYVADKDGSVIATTSENPRRPRLMSDLLVDDEIEPVGHSGAVGKGRLRDGTSVLVATKSVPTGQIAIVQPYAAARLEQGRDYLREALLIAGLLAIAGFGIGYRRRARRKRMQRTVSHRIDTSLTHGRCGVWDWDTKGHRVFWSASMYQLLGYEPRGEHLSAGEVIALIHPDDSGDRGLLAALQAKDPGALDREIRMRTAKGEWIWLRIKGETIGEPGDGSRRLVGLAIDVTAERQSAEARARDDLRLREAVEALSEAFVLWDAEDRLIVCNSKFLALHGIGGGGALPGTPSREIMAASRPPLVSHEIAAIRADEEGARRIETQISDGRWFHVSEHRTRDGGVVSVGTDVSELKRKEARFKARERHLQGTVRAAETVAQCYALAAERNYEANQAKTEFLARVSHELRTPLNAIIGFSDVMRQQILGPLDERYAGYATGIHASGVKLLEIIDAILQMSRIEKKQLAFTPEILALDDVVREVIETVREDIDAKGISVQADVRGPMMIQADAAAIREILLQLVRNAVKFSLCQGNVRVRVRSANGRINVFVEDAGIGIPADILPELGRPFAQVESEYSRSCGGAGLGLAIAQSLTEMHGGRLTLRSQPGTGTIALVNLPSVQPAANDQSTDDHAEPRPLLVAAE